MLATDSSGNQQTTAPITITINNSTTTTTQGTWVSPEGATINVNSAGSWTIAQIYKMIKDNAAAPGDFATIAPHLTVFVQDTYSSQTTMGYLPPRRVHELWGLTST